MDLTHQCPITSLHKCKSHTVHQWINSCYYSCNCPQDQRWNHDKIRGGVEPERRSSSRFRAVPSKDILHFGPWKSRKEQGFCLQPFCMWTCEEVLVYPSCLPVLLKGHEGMQLQVGSHHIPWLPDLSIWAIRTWQPKRRVRGSLPTACVSCIWNWYSWVLASLLFVVKKLQRASCLPTQGQHGLWKELQCLWL